MQQGESLRDRKRRLARNATQKAAIELSLEHGVDAVTVDMICDRVGISPRTFYNYFPAREHALLGDPKPQPTQEAIDAFLAAQGVSDVEACATLVAETWLAAEPDRELFRMRRRLLDTHPDLAAIDWGRRLEARAHYASIVRERLALREPDREAAELATDAQLVVSLAVGMLQVFAHQWAQSEPEQPMGVLVRELFPRVRRLTQATDAPTPAV
ncbi:TetR/AcrR family transcriptional regulator [Demequina sp. NBRC 110053]|uniref:TetR/AcrR family transcriptional regulator n=1 Tax=Demequina sp. NBRC 110053 TaxID=1570342 RepID=UPI00135672EB|nr:TetR/AcrR family transcriptional regulator [Demequina sp. NBRC 110053]